MQTEDITDSLFQYTKGETKMGALWDKLSGYKTILAGVLGTLLAFSNEVLVGIWHVAWPWLPQMNDTLAWITMALGVTGLVHKAVKASGSSDGA